MVDAARSDAAERPGPLRLRSAPDGLPAADLEPPVIAESGDPFAALRVIELVARIERGHPVRVSDLADRLNATHPGWLFEPRVVVDNLVALQANWLSDYRNGTGIVLEEGPFGATVAVEDSSRVDPWMVRQAERVVIDCRERLLEFGRRDRATGDG